MRSCSPTRQACFVSRHRCLWEEERRPLGNDLADVTYALDSSPRWHKNRRRTGVIAGAGPDVIGPLVIQCVLRPPRSFVSVALPWPPLSRHTGQMSEGWRETTQLSVSAAVFKGSGAARTQWEVVTRLGILAFVISSVVVGGFIQLPRLSLDWKKIRSFCVLGRRVNSFPRHPLLGLVLNYPPSLRHRSFPTRFISWSLPSYCGFRSRCQ